MTGNEIVVIDQAGVVQVGVVQPSTLPILAAIGRNGLAVEKLILAWLVQATESDQTRAAYRGDILQFVAWCDENDRSVLGLAFTDATLYLGALAKMRNPKSRKRNAKYAKTTRNRKAAAVTSFYRYLRQAGEIDSNPFLEQKRVKVDPGTHKMPPVLADTAAAMLDHAHDARFRTVSTECAELVHGMLAYHGVRVSEVANVDLDDLSRDQRRITYHTKGGKILVKPVTDELSVLVVAYLAVRPVPASEDDADALLLRLDGRRIDRFQIYRWVKRMAALAGAEKVSPHGLRHGFSDTADEEGFGLDKRQQSLGHASPTTTQIYTHRGLKPEDDPAHAVARRVHASRRKRELDP